MRKTRKTVRRHTTRSTRTIQRKSQPTYVIHKWVIFGAACLVVGFMAASSMQSGAAKHPVFPTSPNPSVTVSVTPTDAPVPTEDETPVVSPTNTCPLGGCRTIDGHNK